MRRNAAFGISPGKTAFFLNFFIAAYSIERIHPLECGLIRRKYRRDRRHGMTIENPLVFYPRYWSELALKQARWIWMWARLWPQYRQMKAAMKAGTAKDYMDTALEPVLDDEHEEARAMFQSEAAQAFVAQTHRLNEAKARASV